MRSFFRISTLKRFLPLLMITIFFMSAASPALVVEAKTDLQGSTLSDVYTLADFGYQTDINFQGVDEEQIFGIAFPKNWAFSDPGLLSIRFSHSNLLNPSSSLYIDWNGERIGTTLLTEDNAQLGTLEISIPTEKIYQGYNALKIGFFMGVSEDFCTDYKDQGVWAVIHNDTSINIKPQVVARETELNNALDIFVDSSLLAENIITLVVPDSPSIQHLNALAVMSTKLGQWADWRRVNVQIMTIKEAKQTKPSGNLILFATLDETENFSTSLLPEINDIYDQYSDHNPLGEDDGLISLQVSPFDNHYHILALTGQTNDAMKKSARAAAFDELYEQSNGTWAVVRTLTNVIEKVSDPLTVTFSELGYTNQSVTGTHEQTIQYALPISDLWNVDGEAWIDLNFTHSELINRDLSSVSVLINAIPITSLELNAGNAEYGNEEIRIPLRYLDIGNNIIAFKVNMQFSDDLMLMQESCSPGATPRAWFNISSDSTIRLPDVSKQVSLDLSNFPYGFSDPFTFDGFAFGVPSSLDSIGMSGLADIAFTFGKATFGNPASIDLLFLNDDLSQFNEYSHVVLLGTTGTMINDSLNEVLPLSLDENTGLPLGNPSLLIVETPSGIQTFLETFQDEQSTSYLVLISDGMEGISMAGKFLANPEVRYTIIGNVAIITSAENASAYQIEKTSGSSGELPLASNEEPLAILTNYQSVWVIRVAIGITGLSVVVLLIALFRKRPSSKESREIK